MQYAQLGDTGLVVSRFAFGAMTFTAGNRDFGSVYKVETELADRLVGRSLDAGMQRANGLARFCTGQMHYSLPARDVERDVIPMMHHYGIGLTVLSPLAGGFLSGKYTRESLSDPKRPPGGFRPVSLR